MFKFILILLILVIVLIIVLLKYVWQPFSPKIAQTYNGVYQWGIETPIEKVKNIYGSGEYLKHPEGDISINWIRFESHEEIKLKNQDNYKAIDAGKIKLWLLFSKGINKSDQRLLDEEKSNLVCLFRNDNFPIYLSGSDQIIEYATIDRWFLYSPQKAIYFYVHLARKVDASANIKNLTSQSSGLK